MIIKSYELGNINKSKYQIYLIYGKNAGLQNEIIDTHFIEDFEGQIIKYEESEIISKSEEIISGLMSKSFFENKKTLIISRVSDKILNLIEELFNKDFINLKIILRTNTLEKKSKLRNFFEKKKEIIIIPTYEDNDRSLSGIVINFLKKHNIKISREAINLVIRRANGDRQNLNIELGKIFNYSLTNKNISYETIQKLSNLSENFDVNELVNNYLAKNTKNVAKILNENNYTNEDCILILRTLMIKSKILLSIIGNYDRKNNLDEVIAATKPPIFWKDREIVKIQVKSWETNDLKNKIYEISDIESTVKTNSNNSLNIVSDFFVNY